MRTLLSQVERIANSEAPVLLCGETGTGKELVAQAVHNGSARARGPFVVCDLSAIAPSLLESELFGHRRGAFTSADHERVGAFARAHGGTIFLDEVGELDGISQPRLLRAIERREIKQVGGETFRSVDVRVIAATNRDLRADVAAGRFRSDLFHRLAVVCLDLPPLRERHEDIPALVEHMVAELCETRGRTPPTFSADAMECLCRYEWPGNVRELRNVLHRALSLSPDLSVLEEEHLHLPTGQRRSGVLLAKQHFRTFKEAKDQLLEEWESDYLRQVLDRADGNLTLAARYAGIARTHFYRLLKKHGLSR